ncbi:MAG: acyl-CoA dehydrogenase family protein [Gammaproteobacteria bacterium]|nr:acyl-CoA dehydrogenase family protein [Gammaproteobacteria bacterium]
MSQPNTGSVVDLPFFGDDHRTLDSELRAWANSHREVLEADHRDVDAACQDLARQLAEGGWLDYVVPAAHGGRHQTLDLRALCLVREGLAYHCGLADFVFAMQGLGSGAVTLFGSPELQASYLPQVRQGRKIAAFALTEQQSGSDVANMQAQAVRKGDVYVLNGAKTYISNAGLADFYTVFVRTGEAAGARGISAFLVDATTPGLRVTERIEVIAPHPLGTIEFHDCEVRAERMLGVPGEGFRVAMATLDVFRTTVGAAALGFARRALDEALARASSRELFGAMLSDQQIIQAMLADMAVEIDASALLIYRAGWLRDVAGQRVTREAAMAKLYATEAAQRVIDSAVQIFGGLGVVHGVMVEKLYREIRALRIYEGASEVQKIIIARQLLAHGAGVTR